MGTTVGPELIITGRLFLVEFSNLEDFKGLRRQAKDHNGHYISSTKGLNETAFAFRKQEDAESFLRQVKRFDYEAS